MKRDCYTRPARPLRVHVTHRRDFEPLATVAPAEIVTVDRATECHVTPPDVAARMVHYLGNQGDGPTLEPSAGTGNLSRALIAAGHEVLQVERHIKLAGMLHEHGPVINRCFLEYATEAEQFDRIIMNPPFSNVRAHVAAAVGLLAPGGCLVALVPITFEHPRAELLENLNDDTFSTARVRTKIIRITRG